MKSTLLCISDSDKHFTSAIAEYTKRLWSQFSVVEKKPYKWWTAAQAISHETDVLINELTKKYGSAYKILLEKWGKQFTSEKFAWVLREHSHVVFVIGWPYGVDMKLLTPYVDSVMSFGEQTMPHWLAKLVLLEQVYRGWTIATWKKYHY